MATSSECLNSAEKKFMSNDFEAALTLANEAKNINPNLDGIDNFIAAYQIHAAASKKRSNGLIDWYAVLGMINFETKAKKIKKSYTKLALMVHPDKNCSAAAEGAFKLIKDAWDNILATWDSWATTSENINSAEEKFMSNNFKEALNLAKKAKDLTPNCCVIDNYIAAYQIHLAASVKNWKGLSNWYTVLGIVNFEARTEIIKNSYQNLALMVSPDKNGSAAASGAFKLINYACVTLSNPSTRRRFDHQWGYDRSADKEEEAWTTSFNPRPWNLTISEYSDSDFRPSSPVPRPEYYDSDSGLEYSDSD